MLCSWVAQLVALAVVASRGRQSAGYSIRTTAEASISQVYGRDLMYDDVRVCVGIMVPQLVSLSDGGPIEINIIVGYCR